jgi:hypothetical protein
MDAKVVAVGLQNPQRFARQAAHLNVADVGEVRCPDLAPAIHRARDVQVEALTQLLVGDTQARAVFKVEEMLALFVGGLVAFGSNHLWRIDRGQTLRKPTLELIKWLRLE